MAPHLSPSLLQVEKSLLKLHDRDTVQNALAEIIAMAEDMKTEHGQMLVSALSKFEDPKNAFARSNLARLFPAVAQANYGLVQVTIPTPHPTSFRTPSHPISPSLPPRPESLNDASS
jgi:hypothetical protein